MITAIGCATLFSYLCSQILDLLHIPFLLFLHLNSKLPDTFHETFYCSMCDDGLPFFEISAINADKPPLSIAEIKRRVEQFRKAGMAQCHVRCQLCTMTSIFLYH
jgi:hypothetical protein